MLNGRWFLVAAVSFPGSGPDGEAPPPGIPARDETGADAGGLRRGPYQHPGRAGRHGDRGWNGRGPGGTAAFGRAGGLAGPGQQAFAQGGAGDALSAGPLLTILAGREMDPGDALAASAYYDALAQALRKGGVPGSLRELRHLAFTERNKGGDPLDLIARHAAAKAARDQDQPPWEQDPGRVPDGQDTDGAGASPVVADPRQDGLRDDGYRDDEDPDRLDDEADGTAVAHG
jgi:hypothetical protein